MNKTKQMKQKKKKKKAEDLRSSGIHLSSLIHYTFYKKNSYLLYHREPNTTILYEPSDRRC